VKSQWLGQSSRIGDAVLLPLASMSGDHGVYALFMKMDDVKYGFFMRLGTHKTEVVAEL
jgi:hypothetical protein